MRKLLFLLFAVTMIFSCGKDAIEPVQIDEVDQYGTLKNGVTWDYVNLAMRAHIYNVVNEEISAIKNKKYGEAKYSAILTNEIVSHEGRGYALSLLPIFDEEAKETSAIAIFVIHANGGEYRILSKKDLRESRPFSINVGREVIDKTDMLGLFENFDAYFKCPDTGCTGTIWHSIKKWWYWNMSSGQWVSTLFGDGAGTQPAGQGVIDIGLDLTLTWADDDDIVSIPPNIIDNGGNVTPVSQSFENMILILQMDCSDDVDPDGAGIDDYATSQIPVPVLNAVSLEIHQRWCKYKENCLGETFEMVSPIPVPVQTFGANLANPYYHWAEYWMENQGNFPPNGQQEGCVTLDEFGNVVEDEDKDEWSEQLGAPVWLHPDAAIECNTVVGDGNSHEECEYVNFPPVDISTATPDEVIAHFIQALHLHNEHFCETGNSISLDIQGLFTFSNPNTTMASMTFTGNLPFAYDSVPVSMSVPINYTDMISTAALMQGGSSYGAMHSFAPGSDPVPSVSYQFGGIGGTAMGSHIGLMIPVEFEDAMQYSLNPDCN